MTPPHTVPCIHQRSMQVSRHPATAAVFTLQCSLTEHSGRLTAQGSVQAGAPGLEHPWRHISEEDLSKYHSCVSDDAPGAEAHLSSALGLPDSRHDVPQAARVVFVTAALAFASRERLLPQQQGVLVNVCHTLLAAAEGAMSRSKAQQGAQSLRQKQPLPTVPTLSTTSVCCTGLDRLCCVRQGSAVGMHLPS